MCFTPKISITTALVEFFVAVYVYLTAKRIFAVKLLVLFIYLLGMYQFSEFMLCRADNPELWARIGFLAYNFLPAIGLHFVLSYTRSKFPPAILYALPIIFAVVAIFANGFIAAASCQTFFVRVETYFYRAVGGVMVTWIYWLYYFGYIFASALLLVFAMKRKEPKLRRMMLAYSLIALMVSLVPAFVLVVMFPSWGYMFPSIYCEFALIFALLLLIGVRRSDEFKK